MKKKDLEMEMKEFEESFEFNEDINNLPDAIKAIKLLMEENQKIKQKLDTVEKNFKEYKEKIDLNFLYNSLDPKAYKLDDIYKNLFSKDIIQNERDFYLINQGIQHLFKKNIVYLKCIYKSNGMKFELDKFNKHSNNAIYSILLFLTQDGERFGAFMNNEEVKNINNKNNMNNMGFNCLNSNSGININSNQGNNLNNNSNVNSNDYQNYNLNSIQIKTRNPWSLQPNPFQMNPPIVIFNSSQSEKVDFVFSLDNSKIYYSNSNFGRNIIPNFVIQLKDRVLQGCENTFLNVPNSEGNNLVKTPNFNIMEIELYSIHLSYF